jgi:murein DD-endopeptidase MepM/ murein hydrolase activator NlpD
VLAARSGDVISVGYMGAYGLVVILDNGNHFATVYAHLSKSYVRVGQYVSTRQVIAAVGNTGWSTGPHLHFEVRIDGQHVDPMLYL